MAQHWSTHQLTEYFAAISAPNDRRAAIQVAAERAAEALDAEVGAVVLDSRVSGCVGLGVDSDAVPLLDVLDGASAVQLPGLVGLMHATSAKLSHGSHDAMLVCRFDEHFTAEERHMLRGMAQVLGLTLRSLDVLAGERALREERERESDERLRLLDALTARQHLLEKLLAVQRAIAGRQPLQLVLDAITDGAAGLLSESAVRLMLADPFKPQTLICASTSRQTGHFSDPGLMQEVALAAMAGEIPAGRPGTDLTSTRPDQTASVVPAPAAPVALATAVSGAQVLLATPVVVDGRAVGSLVATTGPADSRGEQGREEKQQTLMAFAQQVSLALTDAQALEAIDKAYHDPLTGLANRGLFISRLDRALSAGAVVNVLFIDLDRFKAVNDSLGHAAGDELLTLVAERLKGCLREEDHAARLGGDEFAILVPDIPESSAIGVARRIIGSLTKPFRIAGHDVLIGASVGVACSRTQEGGAAELLADADVAMYQAKKGGTGKVTVFEPAMQARALDTLSLSSDLQHALAEQQLDVRYQPVVNLRTGRAVALEAIARWPHPWRGEVQSDVFVPLAEQTGLIVELGRWVLLRSLGEAASWRRGSPDVAVSVNVSARQLVDPGFTADVETMLDQAAVPPEKLILELTESALMTHLEAALPCLHALSELGILLSLDDFGTSHSSLSHLRRFPVDLLKIDGSFVRSMPHDTREKAMVRAVLGLGKELGIATVAEGIETPEELELLRANDCDLGQGLLLGGPMPAAQLPSYLAGAAAGDAGTGGGAWRAG